MQKKNIFLTGLLLSFILLEIFNSFNWKVRHIKNTDCEIVYVLNKLFKYLNIVFFFTNLSAMIFIVTYAKYILCEKKKIKKNFPQK